MAAGEKAGPRLRDLVIFTAALVLAAVYFNASFNSFAQVWVFDFLIPAELIILLAITLSAWALPAIRRPAAMLGAIFFTAAALLHALDVSSRAVYGRNIDLVFDAAQIPHVLDMAARAMGWPIVAAVALGATILIGSLAAFFVWIARHTHHTTGSLLQKRGPKVRAGAAIAVGFLAVAAVNDGIRPWGEVPAVASARSIDAALGHVELVSLWVDGGRRVAEEFQADRGLIEDGVTMLPGLKGRDVYLIFVESYGASLLERDEHRTAIQSIYEDYSAKFAASGRNAASAQLVSSTFGGLSWLAHMTIGSGEWIDNNLKYKSFLNSGLDTLQTILGRSGYETHLFMPGIRRIWPEGERLGFDRLHVAADLGYEGVHFGYFFVPDQFTLERVPALARAERPLFVQVALISSHYPFRPIPPFIEDRARLSDPAVFAERAKETGSFEITDWENPADGYIAAARYSLRSALDFADRHTSPKDVVIILGDHQPWAVVSGQLGGWATPIHVISGDDDILRCFRADGYANGLMPERNEGLYGMDHFLHRLINHFGRDTAPAECGPPWAGETAGANSGPRSGDTG